MSEQVITTGTCLACGQRVPIVNHRVGRFETGYLARHSRPGVSSSAKCRGSFGAWVERA